MIEKKLNFRSDFYDLPQYTLCITQKPHIASREVKCWLPNFLEIQPQIKRLAIFAEMMAQISLIAY